MDSANWWRFVAGVKEPVFRRKYKAPLLKTLERNSQDLQNLSQDFKSIAPKYDLTSFYQVEDDSGQNNVVGFFIHTDSPVYVAQRKAANAYIIKVVSETSARMMIVHEEVMPMQGSHSSMCKFDVNDERFDRVWRCIQRIARPSSTSSAPSTATPAPNPASFTESFI